MKQSTAFPRSGQFVAVWSCSNTVWTQSYEWIRGELFEVSNYGDDLHKEVRMVKFEDTAFGEGGVTGQFFEVE